jgi:putative thioredoxin
MASGSANSWVLDVTEARFERDVLERSRQVPVLVDFTAEWCGPCQVLGPVLERLAAEYQGRFILAKIDIDRNPNLAMQLGVQNVPTVFAFRDGRPVGHFVGALPEERVRDFLAQLVPSAVEEMIRRAHDLVAVQPAAALQLLDEAARQQPGSEDLAALRAAALLRLGRDEEARAAAAGVTEASRYHQEAANVLAVLAFRTQARQFGGLDACRAKVEADPKNAQAHYELGVCLAAAERYEEALRELLAAAEADPRLAGGPVKETMVKVFGLLGPESELADDYRSRLAALLY